MNFEETVKSISIYLSLGVEALGAILIAIGLIQFLIQYIPDLFVQDNQTSKSLLRVRFGSSLAMTLELLLAADILRTAVAPTWEDIGKLAAIAAIRTALNYFLERELRTIERRVSPDETRTI
jgi:uncharacterized membrane protein